MPSLLRRGASLLARSQTHRSSRRCRPEVALLEGRRLLSGLSAAEPSAEEQAMLQLINRTRANPSAEAQRLLALSKTDRTIGAALVGWNASAFLREMTTRGPVAPLAFNPRLIASSRSHNTAMVAENAQFHTDPGELARPSSPSQLAPDGQPFLTIGNAAWATAENVFAYSGNLANPHGMPLVEYFHAAFLLDWGNPDFGHLKNLLLPGPSGSHGTYPMSEIGIGITTDTKPTAPPTSSPLIAANAGINVGPALVTQQFAWRSGHQFLTGAIYSDRDGDQFYTPGEGLGGVKIEAVGTKGEGTFSVLTWGSGGYSLDVPPGVYVVTASGGGLPSKQTTTVTVGQDNVGWDVVIPAPTPSPSAPSPTASKPVVSDNAKPGPNRNASRSKRNRRQWAIHHPRLARRLAMRRARASLRVLADDPNR